MTYSTFVLTVVGCALLVGSATDIMRFKVYNRLTFPVFFGGFVWGTAAAGVDGFLFAASGASIGLMVLLLPYLMGGLGAGDVKFVMAIGTWVGAGLMLPSIILGSLAVLLYHALILARHKGMSGLWHSFLLMMFRLRMYGLQFAMVERGETVQNAASDPHSPNYGRLIPFSAMISIGIVIVLAHSWYAGTLPR